MSATACSGTDATAPADAGPVDAAGDAGSSANDGGTKSNDAGALDASDGGAGDGGSEATDAGSDGGSGDSGSTEAGALPLGTRLVQGDAVLLGVTSDDLVIFKQGSAVGMVPVAGGQPQILFPNALGAQIAGATVLAETPAPAGYAQCAAVSALEAWTPSLGKKTVAQAARGSMLSPDGSRVAFAPIGVLCRTADEIVVTIDGSAPPATIPRGACRGARGPSGIFGANNVYVDQSCVRPFAYQIYVPPAYAPVGNPSAGAGSPPVLDPSGRWLWQHGPQGAGAQLVRTSDGAVVFSDPGTNIDIGHSRFDRQSENLYYWSAFTLFKLALSGTPSATALAANATEIDGLSPDGQYIATFLDFTDTSQNGYYLVPTAAGGTPLHIPQPGLFTADSAYLAATAAAGWEAIALPGGQASPLTGIAVQSALWGSRLLGRSGNTDSDGVLLSASGSPAPLVFSHALRDVFAAEGGHAIVFTDTASPGIYVLAVP